MPGSDEYDAYIIVSFVNATLVLSIGETVEEVTDSGFLGTTPTLSCSQLGDDALVQVSPSSAALLGLYQLFLCCCFNLCQTGYLTYSSNNLHNVIFITIAFC